MENNHLSKPVYKSKGEKTLVCKSDDKWKEQQMDKHEHVKKKDIKNEKCGEGK